MYFESKLNSMIVNLIFSLLLTYMFPLNGDLNVEKSNNYSSIQDIYLIKDSTLRHVVLFNWNDDIADEKLEEIETAFANLPSKINEIIDFEWGTNNSPEGLDKGFTHCFFVSFATEDDRDNYLPHPDHKAFVELAGPYIKDVLVIDYWTK